MNYYFGQQHIGTTEMFDQLSASNWYHTVNIKDSPHHQFVSGNTEVYEKYLRNSWAYYKKSEKKIPQKIKNFKSLISEITKNRGNSSPIEIVERFDGKNIVHHGNHRMSICLYHNIEPNIRKIELDEYIKNLVVIDDEFYGTKHRGMPYQSIFYQGKRIIEGRRQDIEMRSLMIDKRDLLGKSVIDLGCNLGMSLLPIFDNGVTEALGIEINEKIITCAIRLNVLFGLPIRYKCHDLSQLLNIDRKYHTGFVFSIDQHVKNNRMLAKNIKNLVSDVVYFETHQKENIPEEISEIFDQIDYISETYNNRQLYRCFMKKF
jgi:2-polyprenyl-3-methyl-5-hydroxy-6-metoxy-1,4-benzoquinol methylase